MQERPSATSSSELFLEPPGPFSLALPFAILGLVGGWLTAAAFRLNHAEPLEWLLIGITPISAAVLGRFLSPRLRSGALTTGVRLVASIIGAGIANGALVGLFVAPPIGLLLGVLFGAMCAVPFIPALVAVALMARRIGRARPASIVDQADRRAVFRVTLVIASIASALSPPSLPGYGSTGFTVPFAMVTFLLILLVLDVSAFVRTSSLNAHIAAIPAPGAERPDRAADAAVIDFGLGDEEVEEVEQRGAVYRDHARTIRVFRGSAPRARAELAWAVAADCLAVAIAGGLLLARAAQILGEI